MINIYSRWVISNEDKTQYQLIGILSYYISQKKDSQCAFYKSYRDDKWYCYRNLNIERVDDIENIDKGIPYLMFYQKKINN
jgi:hypothetical protein